MSAMNHQASLTEEIKSNMFFKPKQVSETSIFFVGDDFIGDGISPCIVFY